MEDGREVAAGLGAETDFESVEETEPNQPLEPTTFGARKRADGLRMGRGSPHCSPDSRAYRRARGRCPNSDGMKQIPSLPLHTIPIGGLCLHRWGTGHGRANTGAEPPSVLRAEVRRASRANQSPEATGSEFQVYS